MCGFCVSRKGGTRGGKWDHPQGDMHMVVAKLGCERAMVGTGYATSHPDCMDRLTKHYWKTLSGHMTTESADYCMLVNEVKVTSLLIKAGSGLGFSYRVRGCEKDTRLSQCICVLEQGSLGTRLGQYCN